MLLKAAIARPEFISLEIIDIQANPLLAEQYNAFSVPVCFANEVMIARGAQQEELFMVSLEKLEQQNFFIPESDAEQVDTDVTIIGGGPAGLDRRDLCFARSGLKAVIIERGALGGQVALTPVVENYPGFSEIGGRTLVDIMVSHALEYVAIYPDEEVMEIKARPAVRDSDQPAPLYGPGDTAGDRRQLPASGYPRRGAPGRQRGQLLHAPATAPCSRAKRLWWSAAATAP